MFDLLRFNRDLVTRLQPWLPDEARLSATLESVTIESGDAGSLTDLRLRPVSPRVARRSGGPGGTPDSRRRAGFPQRALGEPWPPVQGEIRVDARPPDGRRARRRHAALVRRRGRARAGALAHAPLRGPQPSAALNRLAPIGHACRQGFRCHSSHGLTGDGISAPELGAIPPGRSPLSSRLYHRRPDMNTDQLQTRLESAGTAASRGCCAWGALPCIVLAAGALMAQVQPGAARRAAGYAVAALQGVAASSSWIEDGQTRAVLRMEGARRSSSFSDAAGAAALRLTVRGTDGADRVHRWRRGPEPDEARAAHEPADEQVRPLRRS